MAWTETTRQHYRRDGLRYASDATDAEWALIAPHLPPPSRRGRPRRTDLRAVVDAILFLAATGCQWRQLPKALPALFDRAGLFLRLAGQRAAARHQPRAGDGGARARRARGEPDPRHHPSGQARGQASGPIQTFASLRSTRRCKCLNHQDH